MPLENIYWDFDLKTINDFAPAVRGKNSTGYRHLRADHGKYFSRGRVYINGLEGFWSYDKERIMKYHGVSPQRFPYYLKELEFRYNHRKTNLFPLITKCRCHLVPKHDKST